VLTENNIKTVEILQEVTNWENCPWMNKCNGIYWVEKKTGWLIAHQPIGKEKNLFKTPMKKFSKSRRKFKKIGEEIYE
jgi:hypothetical protein